MHSKRSSRFFFKVISKEEGGRGERQRWHSPNRRAHFTETCKWKIHFLLVTADYTCSRWTKALRNTHINTSLEIFWRKGCLSVSKAMTNWQAWWMEHGHCTSTATCGVWRHYCEEQKGCKISTKYGLCPEQHGMGMKSGDSLSGSQQPGTARKLKWQFGIRLLRAPNATLRGEDTPLQEMNPWKVLQDNESGKCISLRSGYRLF